MEVSVYHVVCTFHAVNHSLQDIAVIAVPMQEAQAIVDELYSCGVKGFWNFAPLDLVLPRDASSYNVHLTEGLEVLSYHMLQKD